MEAFVVNIQVNGRDPKDISRFLDGIFPDQIDTTVYIGGHTMCVSLRCDGTSETIRERIANIGLNVTDVQGPESYIQ